MIVRTSPPADWLAWTGPSEQQTEALSRLAAQTLANLEATHEIALSTSVWTERAAQMWADAYAPWSALPEASRHRIAHAPAMAAWASALRRSLSSALSTGHRLGEDLARQLARFVLAAALGDGHRTAVRLHWSARWPLSLPGLADAWAVAGESGADDAWWATVDEGRTLRIHSASGRLLLDVFGEDHTVRAASGLPLGSATLGDKVLVANWADPCFALEFNARFPYGQEASISGPGDAPAWEDALQAALSLVKDADPLLVQELMETIRVVVPLKSLPQYHVSRTEADTVGSIWCSLTEPEPLAEALVHEYGHTKLYLLQRTTALMSPRQDEPPGFFSPWRPDPRPLDGVLHGAFVAVWVARFWRRLLERTGRDTHRSRWELCAARAVGAVRELADPNLFTHDGWLLVRSMQQEALWYGRLGAGSAFYDREETAIVERRRGWALANGKAPAPPPIRPLPVPTLVIKVASRCNLDCTYCYEYRYADQSWRNQPKFMSLKVARQLGVRMAEHARHHGLHRMEVCLHGGEPLLLGLERLEALIRALREAVGGTAELKFGVQTNGVLLDDAYIDFFVRERIAIGVSLDGPGAINDAHRTDHHGRGTHARVAKAIRRLGERGRSVFAGLLCVIDPASDPREVFDHLVSYGSPDIDFLLPHDNWNISAKNSAEVESLRIHGWRNDGPEVPVFGAWLAAAFDHYVTSSVGRTRVRFFDEMIRVLMGREPTLESVGLAKAQLLTVSSGGELQGVDTLKITREGAVSLGLNLFDHTIEEASGHVDVLARNVGRESLCRTCRSCPYVTTCGGGYVPHRWYAPTGFDNPSVYCADLRFFIDHVRDTLVRFGESVE